MICFQNKKVGVFACGVAAVALGMTALSAMAQCNPVETAKLLAGDLTSDLSFGLSVAIEGDIAAVGTPGDDTGGEDAGAVYVFRYDGTNWNIVDKLVASDAAPDDQFGTDVEIEGDIIVVGAWFDDDAGDTSGSAYVFRYDAGNDDWVQEAKLTASDATSGAWFGYRLDISGNRVIIGAWGDGQGGPLAGAAYIYSYDAGSGLWVEEAKLTAADAALVDFMGFAVSIDGDVAAVGAVGKDSATEFDVGAVYVFRYDGSAWQQTTEIMPADGVGNDQFGTSVIVRGNDLFADSFGDDAGAGTV